MKLFFKQNMLHVLLSIVFLSVFIVLCYFSSEFSASTDSLTKDLENFKKDLDYKNQELSFYNHVESDTSSAVKDLVYLAGVEKEVSLFLKYIFNETENVSDEWTSKSAESVNASLTRLLPRLRKKCLGSNINLPKSDSLGTSPSAFQRSVKPEISDFGFSFSSYDGFWPSFSTTEARRLGIQTEIVKEMIDCLSLSTDDNHSITILSLQRESVGEIDNANIGVDRVDASEISNDLLRDLNEIESYVFKLSIQTQTIPLRKLVNKLRPPFLIREFKINPVEDEKINDFNTPMATPDPFSLEQSPQEKFLPIVSKVDSRVDLIIEYVIFSNRALGSIFDSLSSLDELHPDILFEWLEDAGHISLLERAKEIFNEENNRQ